MRRPPSESSPLGSCSETARESGPYGLRANPAPDTGSDVAIADRTAGFAGNRLGLVPYEFQRVPVAVLQRRNAAAPVAPTEESRMAPTARKPIAVAPGHVP